MRLSKLKRGDEIWCLRIKNDTLVYFKASVISSLDGNVSILSEYLSEYTFTRLPEKEINGLFVILDSGGEIDNDVREYIFETLDACKEFAIKYCKNKIKTYEQNIQTIEAW